MRQHSDNKSQSEDMPVYVMLEYNRKHFETVFAECGDLAIHPWSYGPELEQEAFSVYFNTLIDPAKKNDLKDALENLIFVEDKPAISVTVEDVRRFFEQNGASSPTIAVLDTLEQAVNGVLDGKVVLFFQHWNKALAYSALDIEQRQPSEPITEPSVQGPHVSMIENLERNIGVLRNLLKSPKLKFEFMTVGQESRRTISFGYLDGVVDQEVLAVFKERINQIGREEIIDTSYLEEWIGDSRYSPFPQVRYTERPDTAVLSLLDGKILALVNGSPSILVCPSNFLEFFSSSEDYYFRSVFSSLIRMLRMTAFIIAFMLPSTYIALSTFHSELIPTVLLLAILKTREGIPFPAMLEALIMEFFFELLREAGIRLPRPIGSAVSIVGALVIGQAAIQSQIASPVMVIVVALTGIASFAFPQYNMAIAIRILRFPLMILAATFGGLGIMVGLLLVFLHLATLRSLGQPYLATIAPFRLKRLKDVFLDISRHTQADAQRSRHLRRKLRRGG
ncbi:spore germination protein [Paenibacillus sp. J5C_2022]|uniref:spore germination protein n=1 Tax=Paenibacillus sp. J5C2022 TaxID=2977129 RepID=UPI0021D2B036|nr:spore germination protein [Paenibacillus sp. J5C2022]MCU6708763.1 spore germination protein [Paenibacillus sp. J5C2022]